MGERILVADGNPASAEMLCRSLVKLGSETVVCENGEDCLAEVGQGGFSMIFTEINMAGISGLDVLTSIRQKYDPIELPVIIVTEHQDDNLLTKAIDLGANDFLRKPVNSMVAISKIYKQLLAVQLHKKKMHRTKSAIIKSMIATYNHEINNTLSDAIAELQIARMNNDSLALVRVAEALQRIGVVVQNIEALGPGEIEETGYLLGGKLLRLGREPKV